MNRTQRLGFLLLTLVLTAFPTLAQDEASVYADPAGRFSVAIPAGWTDESTPESGMFTKDGVSVTLLAVEAEDAQEGLNAALAIVLPDFSAEPVQSSDIPA